MNKKLLIRICFIFQALSLFILLLWVSLVPMINSEKFFQGIWKEAGVYEQMNISEEELTKVINHTMDYLWDKNDDLQIKVTFNDGRTEEFYKKWPFLYDGKIPDELAHMADCKVLFVGGRNIAIGCLITFLISTGSLILMFKDIKSKDINTFFITNGIILGLIGFVAIIAATNFDLAFETFHKIFFTNSQISWIYPARSYMIQMLPQEELFAKIVYNCLTIFFSLFFITNGAYIAFKKLYLNKYKN